MKIFHATAARTNLEAQWAIPEYRWELWCAAFQVTSLDGLFDMAPAESVIGSLNEAIRRFDTDTDELRSLLDPQDFEGMLGNKRRLQGMRKFLTRNGGTFSGAFDDSELDVSDQGDSV